MKTAKKSFRVSIARKQPSFGDLCEMSDGLAVVWRRNGCTEREMLEFVDDAPFILCNVIPALHKLGFSEDDVLRHVPHDGVLARIILEFMTIASKGSKRNASTLAVPPWILMSFFRRILTRRIAAMKNKATRNIHYEAEKLRRRAMAVERRRITCRTTTNPCPSSEALLNAWRHVRDSKESLVRFGSMMQDLECYVDNSLRFDRSGRIVGRNAGVKGWLWENLPEMAAHYTSVIRYKAAAKKLRQLVGLTDPIPVAVVLGDNKDRVEIADENNEVEIVTCNYCAEKFNTGNIQTDGAADMMKDEGTDGINEPTMSDEKLKDTGKNGIRENVSGSSPPVEVVRARAVYLEIMDGVPDVAARVMARIDALCDPERTDEVATLRSWREKYANAITVRRKDLWWRRLTA